jgi:hypothetical protein
LPFSFNMPLPGFLIINYRTSNYKCSCSFSAFFIILIHLKISCVGSEFASSFYLLRIDDEVCIESDVSYKKIHSASVSAGSSASTDSTTCGLKIF